MNRTSASPPYTAYAAIMATFLGGVALTGVLAHRLRRLPREQRAFDLAVLGLATFKVARTIARDEVTSVLREPFVERAPLDPEHERPVQTGGLRQAAGELVTCSRCVGTWVAAGLAGLDVLAPRFGRMLGWSLAIGGANDWLQAGFSVLTGAANRQG
jgi:hypothetical protein